MKIDELIKYVNSFEGEELSKGAKGALIGHLNEICGSDENRRFVLGVLFNNGKEMSSSQLTPAQWVGLRNWIDPKEINGNWYPTHRAVEEANMILKRKVYRFE